MKAAIVTGEKKGIECRDIPKPVVEPGMLLLRMRYACICGSDLEYLDGSLAAHLDGGPHAGSTIAQVWGSLAQLQPGGVLGHEYVAEVAEVGPGVDGWQAGDRVVPMGHYLVAGYGDKGCMAEYFLRPPEYVTKVPDSIPDEEAALIEPLAVSINAVNWADLKPGDSLVIIGTGKIGLGTLVYAKASGIKPIIVTDLLESRLEKALEMGADIAVNAKDHNAVDEVFKHLPEGADAVIPCVREGKVLNQAVEMVKMYGIIPIAGFISPTEVDPGAWLVKEIRLLSFRSGPPGKKNSINTAIRLLANRQVNVSPLITEILPLDDVQKAFDSAYSGRNIAVLLKP